MITDNKALKKGWPIIVRLLVPLVLLAVIWTLADAEDALARLGNLNWGWVALAFVGVNLQTIGSADTVAVGVTPARRAILAALGDRRVLSGATREPERARRAWSEMPRVLCARAMARGCHALPKRL